MDYRTIKGPYISNKNHKTGCKACESCGSSDLKRTNFPQMQLMEWECKVCKAEHFWSYENDKDFLE